MTYDNLALVLERPRMFSNTHAVRIYTTDSHVPGTVRYHVGLPDVLMPQTAWSLADSEMYMGDAPWHKADGFRIYATNVTGTSGEPLPIQDLQKWIVFSLRQLNKARAFLSAAGG